MLLPLMSPKVRRLICLLVCVSAACAPALAQGRRGGGRSGTPPPPPAWKGKADVSGKVFDENGKGIDQAKVTMVHSELKAGFFAMTKKNGEFEAKDIKAGEWKAMAEAPSYLRVVQTIQVTEQKNPPIEFRLAVDHTPELIAKGDELFQAGKFAEARAEYIKVLEAHPEATDANRAIAFTYGRERNHAEALKYLDLALAAKPDDTTLLQLAAASAMEVNDFARAMGYLAKIDAAAVTEPAVLVNPAVNLLTKRQAAHAAVILDRAITRFPDAPEAYFYRALIRLQAQDNAAAKADLEKFVALAPPDAPQITQAKELLSKLK